MGIMILLALLLGGLVPPVHAITLAWDYPAPSAQAQVEAQAASSTFTVQRQLAPDETWTTVGTVPLQTGLRITYEDRTLPTAALYVARYRVLAQTATQTSPASNEVLVTGGGQPRVPQSALTVTSVDSAEPANPGTLTVDAKPSTFWHTVWNPTSAPLPHWIILDLGQALSVDGLSYLPRPTGTGGVIRDYQVFVGDSPTPQTGSPAAQGSWVWPDATPREQVVRFAAQKGRYVQLKALKEVQNQPWTSAAEVGVFAGAASSGPPATSIVCVSEQPDPDTLVITCTKE